MYTSQQSPEASLLHRCVYHGRYLNLQIAKLKSDERLFGFLMFSLFSVRCVKKDRLQSARDNNYGWKIGHPKPPSVILKPLNSNYGHYASAQNRWVIILKGASLATRGAQFVISDVHWDDPSVDFFSASLVAPFLWMAIIWQRILTGSTFPSWECRF